jgi:hypothetical protein
MSDIIELQREIKLGASKFHKDAPEIPKEIVCPVCSFPFAEVVQSKSQNYVDIQGYKMHSMKIIVYCESCKERTAFRLRGYVVEDSCHVKAD